MPTHALIAPTQARHLATDAYIYGYPLVDNYRVLHSYFVDRDGPEYKGPWNTIRHNTRPMMPADRVIQTPNADTLYSQVGADLRLEPLVLSVPPIERARYYSLQFIDLYTFNFAYVGTRTTGNTRGSFLLVGPGWRGRVPDGIKSVLRSETDFVLVLYRTQLLNAGDIENVKRIQAGYRVQSLSQFQGTQTPAPLPALDFIDPLTVEETRTSLQFFNVLNFVLQFCPTHESELPMMARFAQLGVGAGQTFDTHAASPEVQQAIRDGMADAWRQYDAMEKKMASGERTSADVFGTRAYLRNRFLYRMVGAVDGIYGNSKEEAIALEYLVDSNGEALDAAGHRYVLRFAPDQLPPVNAFWSLTMYELPARLLVANPIKRYLINSSMLPDLKRDADGGLTIHLQHQSPGTEKESNWLPAPNGPFFMALRLYWPRPEALEGRWTKPPLQRSD
jgi:hypothetical protein